MYSLATPLTAVKGIGLATSRTLAAKNLKTVKDLLLTLPLRYEDRSQQATISELVPDTVVTLRGHFTQVRNSYKGRRSFQTAWLNDHTGRVQVRWFNNPHIITRIKADINYLVSGKLNDRHTLVQPQIEEERLDTIHTNRIVPIYSLSLGLKVGTLRRLLKHILDNFQLDSDYIDPATIRQYELSSLADSFQSLHFPDGEEKTKQALRRFALEELLGLIHTSHQIKEQWQELHTSIGLKIKPEIQPELPFSLTRGQKLAVAAVYQDLQQTTPMNRLLIGDVGSGKTVVAGLAAVQVVANGQTAALVAPTQILAQQHAQTFAQLFPTLPQELLTGSTRTKKSVSTHNPRLVIGTHAVINHLLDIKPALVVYDEQHRFGVKQRSEAQDLITHPHILTMSATPIPRSLMLSIFSHLQLSVIDELPAGRQPTQTWVLNESKRTGAYDWIAQTLSASSQPCQAIFVCPFIEESAQESFSHVAAATTRYQELLKYFEHHPTFQPRLALLHGRQTAKEKSVITKSLFNQEIDILVTTPIVEVGLDLPAASIIVLESADRFGLASLHQLRGRVGRAGQQGYCLLFSNPRKEPSERLYYFAHELNGLKLAEYDMRNRGAGSLFGTQQHGFEQLRFADWANVELVSTARQIFDQVITKKTWEPLFTTGYVPEEIPLAN